MPESTSHRPGLPIILQRSCQPASPVQGTEVPEEEEEDYEENGREEDLDGELIDSYALLGNMICVSSKSSATA